MKEVFNDILDKNEEIIGVYKPNKFKLFFGNILTFLFASLWLLIPIIFGIIDSAAIESPSLNPRQGLTLGVIVAIVYLLALVLVIVFTKIYYNNLYYAYSNKRIIIRKGIIGVDYKSLDMAMIGAVNVNVSVLDKILRQNTGTITFGSMASPVASMNGGGYGMYRFSNIQVPYEKYREIKTIIDEYKENKK